VRVRLDDLAAGRTPARHRLGVAVVPPRAARRLRDAVGLPAREGVLVRGVQEGSPAARAGLERGDLIVSMGGRAIDSVESLFAALEEAPLEEPLTVGIVRGVEERELAVELGRS
jgi:serine protease Do